MCFQLLYRVTCSTNQVLWVPSLGDLSTFPEGITHKYSHSVSTDAVVSATECADNEANFTFILSFWIKCKLLAAEGDCNGKGNSTDENDEDSNNNNNNEQQMLLSAIRQIKVLPTRLDLE